jgi:hypothetical protein
MIHASASLDERLLDPQPVGRRSGACLGGFCSAKKRQVDHLYNLDSLRVHTVEINLKRNIFGAGLSKWPTIMLDARASRSFSIQKSRSSVLFCQNLTANLGLKLMLGMRIASRS